MQHQYQLLSKNVHFTVRDNLLLMHDSVEGRNEATVIDVQSTDIIARHLPVELQSSSENEVTISHSQ